MNEVSVESAMIKYPKAKKIAVENFTFSAVDDAYSNRANLRLDANSYKWNSHTVKAIEMILKSQGKI